MVSTKTGAARLSFGIIVGLVVMKVTVGIITGSLSTLAQAADSFLDLFAVGITFFAIRIATKPADQEHPFGHGKAENIAAIAQALLIFVAGGSIIYSAVHRIISGATVVMSEAGMAVMAVSIVVSIFLSRYLLRVSRATDSAALLANAHNIAADVYSAAAVLLGLLVVRLTGLSIIDPILALVVAFFILKVSYDVLRHSFGGLVDVKLPETEEEHVRVAITEHFGSDVVNFHKLRTRKAGSQRYIDLHLIMPSSTTLDQAHRMCNHLEDDIRSRLPRTDVTIHVEPCDEDCADCSLNCPHRRNQDFRPGRERS